MIILIEHSNLGAQETYSTAESVATAIATTVENNDGFASGDLVLLGKLGEERSEIVIASGVTGNTQVDHAACVFPHPERTPVSQIMYNQAEIYSATSQGGSYSLTTTITLDVDQPETTYNHTAGTTSTWYKIRYKNSQATTYSDYSDEVQGTGYTEDSLRSITDEVLGDFGEALERSQVARYANGAVRKLVMEIIKLYPDFRTNYTTQTLTSGTSTYSLPTNFLAFKRVDVGTSATNAYKASFESEASGYPDTTYYEEDPRIFIRGSYFGIRPNTCTGNAYIWYWDYPATMDDDADEHGLPLGARELIVFYCLHRAWLSKNQEKATSYKSLFTEGLQGYIEFVSQQRQQMNKPNQEIIFGEEMYF